MSLPYRRLLLPLCLAFLGEWAAAAPAPLANTFIPARSLKAARFGHTATLLGNGKVLVAGGSGLEGMLTSAELYDSVRDTWTFTGPMKFPRKSHTATLLPNGMVLVTGGSDDWTDIGTATTELYNPATGRWLPGSPMKYARTLHTATLMNTGEVLVVGGNDDHQSINAFAEIYSPSLKSWRILPGDPSGNVHLDRIQHTATLLHDGRVLIAGGQGAEDAGRSSVRFDPLNESWTRGDFPSGVPNSRYLHTTVVLADGSALLIGGVSSVPATRAFVYDPVNNYWDLGSFATAHRHAATATVLGNGQVLYAGGGEFNQGVSLASAELYDTDSNFVPVQNPGTARQMHTATLLANGRVLIAGGFDDHNTPVANAELFIPEAAPAVPAGIYRGFVKGLETNPYSASISTEGGFTATVQASGAFTGRLTIDGLSLPFTGVFKGGAATFGPGHVPALQFHRLGKSSLFMELQISTAPLGTDNQITGRLRQNDRMFETYSRLVADRAFYNGRTADTTVPGDYLGTGGTAGMFNLFIPAPFTDASSASYVPLGAGYSTAHITRAGAVTLAGRLVDGTVFTAASALAAHAQIPLITFPLYVPLYRGQGFFSAPVTLDSSNQDNDLLAEPGTAQWLRPYQDVQYYPYGWPEILFGDLAGTKYTVVPGQSSIPGLGDDQETGNALLTFDQGRLASPLYHYAYISPADVVTRIPATDKDFTLAINRATGLFSGVFLHDDSTRTPYQGIICQKGSSAKGFGFFLTTPPRIKNYLGQAGSVNLDPH